MNYELIGEGRIAVPGPMRGEIYIPNSSTSEIKPRSILVAKYTTPDLVPEMMQAQGIITEIGSIVSHAAIVARELKKPCVIGVEGLLETLRLEDRLYVDEGKIYRIKQ